MAVLLRLPRPIAQLVGAYGADADLVQQRRGEGDVVRVLHVMDELERRGRIAQSRAARKDTVQREGEQGESSDERYLRMLQKARETLRSHPILSPVLGSDDPALWPSQNDLRELVDMVTANGTIAAGLVLRTAFEVHELELVGTGRFQLTQESDVRSERSGGIAKRSRLMSRHKCEDVSTAPSLLTEGDGARVSSAVAAFTEYAKSTAVAGGGADKAGTDTVSGNLLHDQNGSVSAILSCDAAVGEHVGRTDVYRLRLNPQQQQAFTARISGGASFADAQPTIVSLDELANWSLHGLHPREAADMLLASGSSDARASDRTVRRMRVESGVFFTSVTNAFPFLIVLDITERMTGPAPLGGAWWRRENPPTAGEPCLRRPPPSLEDGIVAAFRQYVRPGAIRFRGHQRVPPEYTPHTASSGVIVYDVDGCQVTATLLKAPEGAPPLVVMHGHRVTGGTLPITPEDRQTARDACAEVSDQLSSAAAAQPATTARVQTIASAQGATAMASERLAGDALKRRLREVLTSKGGKAPKAVIEQTLTNAGATFTKSGLASALTEVATFDKSSRQYVLALDR